MCFFFQAEDGIRDLVRSRGLGDVYKRQVVEFSDLVFQEVERVVLQAELAHDVVFIRALRDGALRPLVERLPVAVSYTHLTLPTSDLV